MADRNVEPLLTGKTVESSTPLAFMHESFHYTAGARAPMTATIRDDSGEAVLTYTGFSSPVAIVAAVAAAIVGLAGGAAAVFLMLEGHPFNAIIAIVLSIFFALVIAILVPPTHVTLYDHGSPALTIAQRSRSAFPTVVFTIVDAEGKTLAFLRKSVFGRLGRNRWQITNANGAHAGDAIEESLGRAYARKLLGKFSRRYEADVYVFAARKHVATIIRREGRGEADVLHVKSDLVDPRVLVALATLILGSEP